MAEQTTTTYALYDDTEKRFVGAPSTTKSDVDKTRREHAAALKKAGKPEHNYTVREV